MESLKKQRASIRRLITITVDNLEEDLDTKNIVNLRTKNVKLKTYAGQVETLDQQILDLLMQDENISEDDYQNEVIKNDEYAEKIVTSLVKIDMELDLYQKDSKSSVGDEFQTVLQPNKKRYKLPKIELKKFSGKIIDWLSWWALFEKIHTDEELSNADKFQYLLQSIEEKSRAYDLVNSFPASAANYPKAVEELKERFGNEKLLTQVYIRELFHMGLKNLHEKPEISTMYDKLVSHVRSLGSIGVTVDQATLFLFPMVEASLPEDIMIAWQRSSLYEKDGTTENPPKGKLDFLLEFLKQEVEREDERRLMKTGFLDVKDNSKTVPKKKDHHVATASGLHVGNIKQECIFCGKRHLSQDCYTAMEMPLEEKWKIIKQKRICGKCLKHGHLFLKCRENLKCNECSKRHYPILCPDSIKNKAKVVTSNSGSNTSMNTLVILKTILVAVKSKNGPIIVRALFDDGSHRSYITKQLVKKINGKEVGKYFEQNTLFGAVLSDIEERTVYEVSLGGVNKPTNYQVEFADKDKITGRISKLPKGPWMQELKEYGIWINDCESNDEEPDILIGADLMPKLTTDTSITLQCGLKAVQTVFGWTIMGPVPQENHSCLSLAMSIASTQIDDAKLKQLWELETIGIRDPVEVKTMEERNQQTKEHFFNTVSRQADGRYQIALPWVDGVEKIPDNFQIAYKRLVNMSKKLKQKDMFKTYDNLFKQWEEEKFIERISKDHPMVIKKGHFIPHHAVYKPSSNTTPVRPVFDASCKSGRHPSLNECLEKGPNLIELLPAAIIRFRENLIGVLADIRKAFQMIEVEENDQYVLLFLWWEDESMETVIIFKHKRVVFGLKSSPFILAAVIEYHLNNVRKEDSLMALKLKKSLYIDNSVTSVESWEEFLKFKADTTRIMAEAQMDLREWEHTLVLEDEPPEKKTTSVLGLKWCKERDVLSCASFPSIPETFSRRTLLAAINKVFDPMGILSPAMVFPKIILQSTWSEKLDWDEELPDQMKKHCEKWMNELNCLVQIEIPRFMKGKNYSKEHSKEQLHVFCDASKLAYAAAVFLRVENMDGVSIQLIQAKVRVAPIQKATIPRLELMGCTIAARLGKSVLRALEKEVPCFYWSDSTTALTWIKRNDEWGTFVGNRVKEIIKLSPAENWKFVPGKLNPADFPSRGCTPKELLDSSWWECARWLKQKEVDWPSQEYVCNEKEINEERKKTANIQITLSNIPVITELPWFSTSSSYILNLRRLAFIKRFHYNAMAKKNNLEKRTGPLTTSEINIAEEKLIKLVQLQVFPSNTDYIAGLQVIKENGIYCVATKILNRPDNGRFRKPWLLPSNHPSVKQLIIEKHLQYGHAGAQLLVSKLREKFWIIHMKKTVKNVISKCTTCSRYNKPTATVPSTALPENRVKNAKVFEITGIDLAGPLYLKNNSKQWVVIFTCAVIRAVHLELVGKIDTEQFILALSRFISRRGRISVIYTDNGTNFHGTANLFGKLDWEKIQSKFKTERITWIFIPPAAPWWGGFWERMVRILKEYLRKLLGHNKLNKIELDTSICFVESLINSRPLTCLTEDPNDLLPISPSAFMQDIQSSEFPEIEEMNATKIREKLRHLSQLKKELRDRFRSEYLGQLVQRTKPKNSYQFQVGEMVFVQTDGKKKIDWPMARIIELFPGNDGISRLAKLKTVDGQLVRTLNRLIPLELDNDHLEINTTTVEKAKNMKEMPIPESTPRLKTKRKKFSTEEPGQDEEKYTRYGRKIKKPNRFT